MTRGLKSSHGIGWCLAPCGTLNINQNTRGRKIFLDLQTPSSGWSLTGLTGIFFPRRHFDKNGCFSSRCSGSREQGIVKDAQQTNCHYCQRLRRCFSCDAQLISLTWKGPLQDENNTFSGRSCVKKLYQLIIRVPYQDETIPAENPQPGLNVAR